MDLDLERCSASSLDSSSEADRMELEAAEALADLAHLAMLESSGSERGSKGKRAMKRVKSESPPADNRLDQVVVDQQHGEPIYRNLAINPAKVELDADLAKPSPNCATSYTLYAAGKSRLNLTEVEKEERRLRRILANRESARQTIRRRQALCEKLTRKATDLSWENENLKKEKELAIKMHQSLETTNKHLKEQMAKLKKAEVEESSAVLKAAPDIPASSATNCPLFLCNQHAFSPHCWPSIIQSSNPVQSHYRPQNAIVIPSNVPMLANGKHDSLQQQQENSVIVSGPRTPLYIVPCPWFFPVPDHGNGFHTQASFGFKHTQDEASVNNLCCGSSSPTAAAHSENRHASLSIKVKSETASSAAVRVIDDLNETPVGFTQDGGGQCAGLHPKEMIFSPAPLTYVTPTVTVKNEPGLRSQCALGADGIGGKASQLLSALAEKNQDPFEFPSEKLVDAAAAAEARRRRKELTKLKNLHGRQCRMNC